MDFVLSLQLFINCAANINTTHCDILASESHILVDLYESSVKG